VAGPDNTAAGAGTVNYDAVNGPVTLTATISDELGNQGQATFQATVDNNRPQAPVITSPSAGTYNAWSQVSFGANSSDSQSQVRELRLFFASNAVPAVGTAPVWNANGAQPGLVELARIPGASGAVNVRLPDPTNDDDQQPNSSLQLIALAVDQAGNARASFRSLSIRHVASRADGVNNDTPPAIGNDLSGNNNRRFELTFLAPPSGVPIGANFLADPALSLDPNVVSQVGLVGRSQYVLRYENADASAAILEGELARLSFYYLAPASDPLKANLGAAAAIGLPGYVNAAFEVYYLIQDVQGEPYQVNWTLEPTRGLVALIFNNRGHSSIALDFLAAGFMVQATALDCPQGDHSVTANTPIRGVYQIRYFNATAQVLAGARYVRVSGSSGVPLGFGFTLLGSAVIPDGQFLFDTAAAGDATLVTLGLASGSTYTQELVVADDVNGVPGVIDYPPPPPPLSDDVRVFRLCPPGSINVVP
jgi:hypothetical protein